MNELLTNTRVLQAGLLKLSEAQLEGLLNEELALPRPRKLVLERIHQRMCILRAKRERKVLFARGGIS